MTCRSDMLRDYQRELINKVLQAFENGYKAPCIVLPCGGGKSIITAELAKIFTDQDKRVLFLVHRKELCAQIYKTFLTYGVDMTLCQVGMIQTVVRRLNKIPTPKLIITDENHHSKASSYKKIYDYFKDVKRVGVTATPERIDGSGLAGVNDTLILGVTAKWLTANNYLSPYDYYAPAIELPKFHIRNGDYIQGEVAAFYEQNRKKVYGKTIEHYKRLANGKKAICYLPTVASSQQTAQEFCGAGIAAAHLDGTTPKAQRDRIIGDFRIGKIKVLCNVDIVSEGFDVPDCECVILLRPTKSLILYTQQAMRCMRYKEGKRAIIIDHVNNINRFGFPDEDREWRLEGHPHKKTSGEQPLKICKNCFAAVPISTTNCPICGQAFEIKIEEKFVDTQLVKIEQMQMRVKKYLTANECTTVDELKEYAKQHGYKPGWVYYQQKLRGWLGGSKKRDSAAKRYPCRAVPNWNCQAQ